MIYDLIGEKLRKIRVFLENGQYHLAFQELMTILEFIEPGTKDWVKLVNLAEMTANKIEDPALRARALLDLSRHLRRIDYEKFTRVASTIKSLLPLIHDEYLEKEIESELGAITREETRSVSPQFLINEALMELTRIRNKLRIDPYAASELEDFYSRNKSLFESKIGDEVVSLLNKYPPDISMEIETLSPNRIYFPSNLEFKIKLLNKGYRTANNINIVVKLDSNGVTEEHVINPIVGSSFKLRPRESKEVHIKVPIMKPGKYRVFVGTKYYDGLGKEYQNPLQQILENLEVVIASISEIEQKEQLDEFNTARVELAHLAYDFLNNVGKLLDAMAYNESENEIVNLYEKLVEDIDMKFFGKLENLVDMYRKYAKSCSPIISDYENIINDMKENVNSLKKISNEKKLEKSVIESENVIGNLRKMVHHVIKILWNEDAEKMEKILNKLGEEGIKIDVLDDNEKNLVVLTYSFSVEAFKEILKKYKTLREILKSQDMMKRYKADLPEYAKEIINELKKLKELRGDYKC